MGQSLQLSFSVAYRIPHRDWRGQPARTENPPRGSVLRRTRIRREFSSSACLDTTAGRSVPLLNCCNQAVTLFENRADGVGKTKLPWSSVEETAENRPAPPATGTASQRCWKS